ncbi:MAG TPA: hypothetical protein VLU25_15125 [Acidobacteriota bacterium]|nr:hypothetical protein [Acidobacteriota bacterium]
MAKRVVDTNQDMVNVLLILLKFIVLFIIGLQGIRTQLGMPTDKSTGVVNTTPETQSSVNPSFPISFYPVIYTPGHDFRDIDYDLHVEAWQCQTQCEISDWDRKTKNGQNWSPENEAGDWRRIDTESESIDHSGLGHNGAVPIKRYNFDLIGPGGSTDPLRGTYYFIYKVEFEVFGESQVHWKRSNRGHSLTMHYTSDEAGPWEMPPLKIVRGRWGDLHPRLEGFQLDSAAQSFAIDSSANRFRLRSDPGTEPVLRFRVTTTVAAKPDEKRFTVENGPAQEVTIDNRTVLWSYDASRRTYIEGRFSELKPSDKVFFRLRSKEGQNADSALAAEVRYGEEVPGSMPVVILENQPPRSVYRGQAGAFDRDMLWHFPYDTFTMGNRWWFDLSRWIVDPDGEDGILLGSGSFRPGSSWPAGFRIEPDPTSPSAQLVFDPDQLLQAVRGDTSRELDFTIQATDGETGWVEFRVTIRVLQAQTLSSDARRIRRVLGQ